MISRPLIVRRRRRQYTPVHIGTEQSVTDTLPPREGKRQFIAEVFVLLCCVVRWVRARALAATVDRSENARGCAIM